MSCEVTYARPVYSLVLQFLKLPLIFLGFNVLAARLTCACFLIDRVFDGSVCDSGVCCVLVYRASSTVTVKWQSGQRQLALPLPRQGCFWTEFCSQRVRASVECACGGVLTAASGSCNFVRGFCPSIVLEFKTTDFLSIQVLASQDRPNLIRKQMSVIS